MVWVENTGGLYMHNPTRRHFLGFLGASGIALFLAACKSKVSVLPTPQPFPTPTPKPRVPPPSLILREDQDVASILVSHKQEIIDIAKIPGKELRVGAQTPQGLEVFRLSMQRDGKTLQMVQEGTGETRTMNLGLKGTRPAMEVWNQGSMEKEVSFGDVRSWTSEEFIRVGTGALAAALGLWLVLVIGGFLLSVISFIAFVALAIGILALAAGAIKEFLSHQGIREEDIQAFLQKGSEYIEKALQDIRHTG